MLPKILLTLIVVAVAFWGLRYLARLPWRLGGTAPREPVKGTPPSPAVEETTRCPACGTYVVSARTRHCGRPDCPYPR